VNDPSSLRGFGQFSDSPAPDLISSCSKEVNKVQSIIACFDDFGQHSPLVNIFVFKLESLMLGAVGDDFSRNIGIDKIFNLLEPLILFTHEIFSTEIDQVDNRFGCDKTMGVQYGYLIVSPFSMPYPFVFF